MIRPILIVRLIDIYITAQVNVLIYRYIICRSNLLNHNMETYLWFIYSFKGEGYIHKECINSQYIEKASIDNQYIDILIYI